MSDAPERRRRRWAPPRSVGVAVQAALRRCGYDIQVYPAGDDLRLSRLLHARGITLVLDVGANAGQYAIRLRNLDYRGRIISFEPLAEPFAHLAHSAERDPLWDVRQFALGDTDREGVMNVAANMQSSSLLPMLQRHEQSAPEARYIGTERTKISRLASLWPELDAARHQNRIWLKLDVQGYELEVLRGTETTLDQVDTVQAEMSLVPLYEGHPSWREFDDWLRARNFRLAGLEAGFEDPVTGELLQVDGIFVRDTAD